MNDENCRRCSTPLVIGKAIRSTLVPAGEDFPGVTDLRGRTLCSGGPGDLIDVLKCPSCGYSRTLTLDDAALRILA